MKKLRFLYIVMVLIMLVGMVGYGAARTNSQLAGAAVVNERVAIGAMPMAGTHLVPPSHSGLDVALRNEGLPLNASPEQRESAEKAWFDKFQKQSDTWVNPAFQEYVVEREKQLNNQPNELSDSLSENSLAPVPVEAKVFALAVDFGATETFNIPVEDENGECVAQEVTVVGPRVGNIPYPPVGDNFTLWYSPQQVSNADFYEKIIFGYQGAGRVRTSDMTDPYDGLPGINLAGYTVQDYYDHVAGDGNVLITGNVEGWVTVPHSEGHYGADNCASGNHGGGAGTPVAQLVIDAVDLFKAANPNYNWPAYDANDDGILDTFWIIHAGMGQESGGGVQGTFSIWSHSSDLRYSIPEGYQVYEGDPGTNDDDIYIGPYTMQPEMAETGVFAEEFGHNFFGLPDLYANDANNSIGDWAIMSGGAWTGWLGGTVPASMPLWFKMIAAAEVNGEYVPLNWHMPMVTRSYDDPAAEIEIGQLEKTGAGVNKGVRVSLPNVTEAIPNNAGTGPGAYSGSGLNDSDVQLTKQIAVPAGADGVLSFDAFWSIETDWDYGYVMVGDTIIDDIGNVFTNTNPEGNNLGWGLTGEGEATLEFDLSAYAGTTVDVTLRYRTDAAVTEAGWWVDNVMLDGVLLDDFSAATAPATFPGWTNTDPGWKAVPTNITYANYYLVEWRADTKYDGVAAETAYVFNNADTVSRVPYNIPAALVYYRNTKYSSSYAQRPYAADAPSLGSKYQLLIVDQNWKAVRLMQGDTYQAYLTGRISAYDAGLTLQPAQGFTIPSVSSIPAGDPYVIPAKPAVTHFNDTLGYYAGFYFGAPCAANTLCYAERDGSAVIPARGPYSARITSFDYTPFYGLYGYPWAPSWLGTGNPGEDNVQYGVNIELLSKAGNDGTDSRATLRFYNYSIDFLSEVISHELKSDGVYVTYQLNIQNVGTEDAADLSIDWYLDPKQIVVDYNVEGPADMAIDQDATGKAAQAEVLTVEIPALASGKEIVVTLETKMPASYAGGEYNLYPELWANDGQVERGPYWNDISGNYYIVRFPSIYKP